MRQWMLKITAYADRLLEDLDLVQWPDSIKEMQRNWIGRSEGAQVDFEVLTPEGKSKKVTVFTTRPDTLFGATYLVLSPEHALVPGITSAEQKKSVEAYQKQATSKSELERTELAKDKTGVFTGAFAVNPVNGEKIPVWVADYVLATYGTGAIMAVPAHDARDWAFAKKYDLKIVEVVSGGDVASEAYTGDGKLVSSGMISGLDVAQAKEKITTWLEEKSLGKKTVNYKLRDWLFSRQRYWGEPIPLVHCKACGIVALDEKSLPLTLPDTKDFKPSGDAEPPLAKIKEWVNTGCPKCGEPALRETNTMPQWAGSCWYYLRYLDPKNSKQLCDPAKEKYWLPVDLYVGGAEHAVLHLLYSRFWHKVLYDLKQVSEPEPFKKLVNQGMILGEDGQKMSKSRGNVVNPDQVVQDFGADSLRLYEMFMGPLTQMKSWSMKGVEGVYRFLGRVWRLYTDREGRLDGCVQEVEANANIKRQLHRTIKKVTEDIESLSFNTAISALMIFSNELAKEEVRPRSVMRDFALILSPFAPHLAEELWGMLGNPKSLAYQAWPAYDPAFIEEDTLEIPIMVNGKVKSKITIPAAMVEEEVEKLVLKDEKVAAAIAGKAISQKRYVPKKIYTLAVF